MNELNIAEVAPLPSGGALMADRARAFWQGQRPAFFLYHLSETGGGWVVYLALHTQKGKRPLWAHDVETITAIRFRGVAFDVIRVDAYGPVKDGRQSVAFLVKEVKGMAETYKENPAGVMLVDCYGQSHRLSTAGK